MPTIAIFFGVIVQMYWRDHPPPKAQVLVRDWALSHRDALMQNWERGRRLEPFETIPGADLP